MGESQAPTLLGNTLAFDITTLIIVFWRIGFRVSRKWSDASDLCIAIAFVRAVF